MGIEKHPELSARTKSFALRIMRMSDALPKTRAGNVVGHQILRSATSVAANYRAAGRARSKAEFIAKIGIVIEEADETVLWLELLAEGNVLPAAKLEGLLTEARQLLAIFSASGRTGQEMTTDHNCNRMPALIGSLASQSRAITRSPDHPILP
jgi:four helix bundle protein